MTAFAIVFTAVFVVAIAAMGLIMPALVPKTLPLGVSVPAGRVDDPVIASAVRRYRVTIVVAAVIVLAIGIGLAFTSPSASVIVGPLLAVAMWGVAYVSARARIIREKTAGQWYQGVPTRLAADVTPTARFRPPVVWSAIGIVVVLAVFAIGVALYPGLPQTFPTHWGASGTPDVYSTKSVWTAFSLPFISLFMVVGFYGLSWLIGTMPVRRPASESPERARARVDMLKHLTASLLGQISIVIALGMGALAVAMWTRADAAIMPTTIAMVVALLAVVVAMLVRYSRSIAHFDAPAGAHPVTASRGASAPAAGAASSTDDRPDAPDDDRYWKGGMLYLNRSDPATFVPKRFGVGWTVNLGSPGGMAFGIVLAAIVVGAIGFAIIRPLLG